MKKFPTISEIEKTINELYPEGFPKFMTNHKWTDEEGNRYSSWNISVPKDPNDPNSRSLTVYTGDGGAEMIMKSLLSSLAKMQLDNNSENNLKD